MIQIGLEIHVQLNTKSKIFCSCPNISSEEQEPNIRTCPTCLGLPGSKPSLNKEVLTKALKVALALNCKINKRMFFSRKTYFYPDLPKNFQITQYEIPLAEKGELRGIRIRRIHLEEDPGKLIHQGNLTLIDYNRSGTPLIEIVTEPDIKSAKEAREFLNKLTLILEYLQVYFRSEETVIKTDCNVSVNDGEKVEVKNINSIKDAERAIEYEIKRQQTEPAIQETRGWDSEKDLTISLRTKETEEDYGYIFEPDLTVIELSDKEILEIEKSIPELPKEKSSRLQKQYKISQEEAETICNNYQLSEMYERVSKKINPILAARWFRRDLMKVLNLKNKNIEDINENYLIELLSLLEQNKITDLIGKEILEEMINKNISPLSYIKQKGLEKVSDEDKLMKLCQEAIKENQQATQDYKSGNEKSLFFLTGKVMQKLKKAGDPKIINKILKELLR